jgi:hypothetical protein
MEHQHPEFSLCQLPATTNDRLPVWSDAVIL